MQAAAARTVQHRDPEVTAAALAAIEETARDATGELDAVLALLREEESGRRTPRHPAAPDGRATDAPAAPGDGPAARDELERLLAGHRRAGMDLHRRGELPADLAPLQHRHLVRGLGELLTNAQRHAAPGPVTLVLGADDGRVHLEVTSPLDDALAEPADDAAAPPADSAAQPAAVPGGHGLVGLRERAALLGGTLEAGPRGEHWIARLDLPLLREEER